MFQYVLYTRSITASLYQAFYPFLMCSLYCTAPLIMVKHIITITIFNFQDYHTQCHLCLYWHVPILQLDGLAWCGWYVEIPFMVSYVHVMGKLNNNQDPNPPPSCPQWSMAVLAHCSGADDPCYHQDILGRGWWPTWPPRHIGQGLMTHMTIKAHWAGADDPCGHQDILGRGW